MNDTVQKCFLIVKHVLAILCITNMLKKLTMSELYYLATGSRYFYSSIRFHISRKPSSPLSFFFFLTNCKQIGHTEHVSAFDSSPLLRRRRGALAAFLSCMEIEPVLHQLSNPPYLRSWVSAFWLLGNLGFLFCFVNCQCIRRQITF